MSKMQKLKTESETGYTPCARVRLARYAAHTLLQNDFEKKPDCFAF